jgi:group II intron reverse transcriptase/maturase
MPVKKVEIPKQSGGVRTLGIPTTLDRLIQQALLQILQRYIDKSFNANSFGFRPKKSAHQAIEKARRIIAEGKEVMIDLDIEKFFDRVNHDRLMSKLRSMIKDQRVLDLIRKYLNSGLTDQGVPQGGPLSPLLANIYLDELDKELTKRKLSFVRYADDLMVFVKTNRAANRVASRIKEYLNKKLKLQINEAKSGIGESAKFLGFMITKKYLKVDRASINAFKDKIRECTKIRGGKSMCQILKELKPIIRGWGNYFAPQTVKKTFGKLDGWTRRRVRACYYAQLKNGKTRLNTILQYGIRYDRAYKCGYSSRGVWRTSRGDVMHEVLNNKRLRGMGLVSLEC